MAIVRLRPPLRDLAEGTREVRVEGSTVEQALRELERAHPRLGGRVLDDRGRVREHVAVFLGGERVGGDAPVAETDRLEIVGSISGGADEAELLVGTRKGLFVLRGPRGGEMGVVARAFAGATVEYAMRDPRTGRYFASVTSGQFGPRVHVADDPTGGWEPTGGPRFPEGEDASVERTWVITPGEVDGLLYAGVAPGALFESRDGGMTWELNRGMWDQPSRREWQPGAGGLALHSIATWPGDPSRLAIGISAAGVWLSEDAGRTWTNGNAGLVARYLPEEARENAIDLCVHNMYRAPLRPERLFMQFHGGVYRSDDAGSSWISIAD
ncbi:MAG TPA: MoaD/ThiS family protein, partial [Actinomycetota bacterium]|nr:MoaD/ThiS family protein [Actinomycetota bacterium]